MAHTPGPWQLRTVDQSLGTIETADGKFIIANTCQLRANDYQSNHAERRANARLIAAAPDLLEALQLAHKALEAIANEMTVGERYTNAGQYLLDSLEPSRAAIAKATGGQ